MNSLKVLLALIIYLLIFSTSFGRTIIIKSEAQDSSEIKSIKDISQVLSCDLTYLTTIENFMVWEHNPSGAILFRAKMAIDADGCPRAYGPDNTGLDWTANAGYPGNWWGIVTDAYGEPIIQGAGDPYPGMYVSSTSLVCSGYADTNPLRYVDSENIPYIALPSALQSLAGIVKGDLAFVRNSSNGYTSCAYFADTGPAGKLGEGSMFLADRLGINSSPKTGGTSLGIIDYIVFPQSGFGQGVCLSVEEIDSLGQINIDAAGGESIADCLANPATLNCSNNTALTFGVTYSGPSSTAPSFVGTYSCNTWTETGPERVHSITPSSNGTIVATISNYSGDLDVYILGSCDPNDCLGTVYSESATITDAIAGQEYFIVIDADDGSGSSYDLVVTFSPFVGIFKQDFQKGSIRVFPNPTHDILYIESNGENLTEAEVLTITGSQVKIVKIEENRIDISFLPQGVYFLKMNSSSQAQTILRIMKD